MVKPVSAISLANLKPLAEIRKCELCGRPAKRNSRYCYGHQPRHTSGSGPDGVGGQRYDVKASLIAIASDPHAAAHARTAAARTLAELDGLIGKHQAAPERTSTAMLASLSRADLANELERLRAVCAADKAQDKR